MYIRSLLFCLIYNVCALDAQTTLGAKYNALGANAALTQNAWSIYGNPAGITFIDKPVVAFDYARNFISSEISTIASVAAFPIKKNYFLGIGFQRYGIEVYHESKWALSYGQKFGKKLSIALNQNFHQLAIERYFNSTGYSLDLGMFYQWNPSLLFAFQYQNIGKLGFLNGQKQGFPSIIAMGTTLKLDEKVHFLGSISRQLFNYSFTSIKLGLDYSILDELAIRTGIRSYPFAYFAGIGLTYAHWQLDLAYTQQRILGGKAQISMSYEW